jgi:HAD superfamily hydrolase (TIGR01456 family)
MEGIYERTHRRLPKPLHHPEMADSDALKVDAMLVFNDPRDWALDIQILLDLLLSRQGILGTYSPRNGDASLPNNGWQGDGQPPIFFSNADLFWSTTYHQPRLAQGAFQAALAGVWSKITGGVELQRTAIGKPSPQTYRYAEKVLNQHRDSVLARGKHGRPGPLKTVYMVGDNPESDIRGANEFKSENGTDWHSILVKTGVWRPGRGEVAHRPRTVADDVKEAVDWALKREGHGRDVR